MKPSGYYISDFFIPVMDVYTHNITEARACEHGATWVNSDILTHWSRDKTFQIVQTQQDPTKMVDMVKLGGAKRSSRCRKWVCERGGKEAWPSNLTMHLSHIP